jgi:hypothetical protein
VHVIISDQRTDGRCPFPTFQYAWDTLVTEVSKEGVTLARGAEKGAYTINRKVVRGRLQDAQFDQADHLDQALDRANPTWQP